jgi:4-hydroxyproline epimerase
MRIEVLDSHTEGEPTRTVIGGWPALRGATMAERREDQRTRFDHLRRALVGEPRGHDALVGAILTEPVTRGAAVGAIFCNDVGYLGMCGHGTIGVVRTLAHLGRVRPGPVHVDTPAGTVAARIHDDGTIEIENVPSYCSAQDVAVEVPGIGRLYGDVAYGGNWFYLTELPGVPLVAAAIPELVAAASAIRAALAAAGITGSDGAAIDHIELRGPPQRADADARTFVLCPGRAYDRSPCGTGTSATMVALHARGALALDAAWRQESITGSLFVGTLAQRDGALIPTIRGRAYVTATATLLLDADDPLRHGFPEST